MSNEPEDPTNQIKAEVKASIDTLPTPIAPLDKQPKGDDDANVLEYYAYNAADRLEYVKAQIEEREKAHFNLYLISVSLSGNPESGDHVDRTEPPCVCRDCELPRVEKLLASMKYAINQLKAVHSGLT